MRNGDIAYGKPATRLLYQAVHLGFCHRLVRLIFEIKRAPAPRLVARCSFEDHYGAIFIAANCAHDLSCFDAPMQ